MKQVLVKSPLFLMIQIWHHNNQSSFVANAACKCWCRSWWFVMWPSLHQLKVFTGIELFVLLVEDVTNQCHSASLYYC
jgi:hypothetical protein